MITKVGHPSMLVITTTIDFLMDLYIVYEM